LLPITRHVIGTERLPEIERTPTDGQNRAALRLPWVRAEATSLLYEQNRHVYALDADLAVLRSFSLAAKITL